jgi:rod shape determining protein RodA
MTIGLLPVVGVPLPFMSYGGTFLLSNLINIGLLLNFSINRNLILPTSNKI